LSDFFAGVGIVDTPADPAEFVFAASPSIARLVEFMVHKTAN